MKIPEKKKSGKTDKSSGVAVLVVDGLKFHSTGETESMKQAAEKLGLVFKPFGVLIKKTVPYGDDGWKAVEWEKVEGKGSLWGKI